MTLKVIILSSVWYRGLFRRTDGQTDDILRQYRALRGIARCWLSVYRGCTTFISCRLDYCNALLFGIADCQLQRLQSVQNAAARLVTGLRRTEHITVILNSLHWLPIRQRVAYMLATLMHKMP